MKKTESNNPFEVPQGYFENKNKRLKQVARPKRSKVIALRTTIIGLAAAACISLFFIDLSPSQKSLNFDALESESMVAYLTMEQSIKMDNSLANMAYNDKAEENLLPELDQDIMKDFLLQEEDIELYEELF